VSELKLCELVKTHIRQIGKTYFAGKERQTGLMDAKVPEVGYLSTETALSE